MGCSTGRPGEDDGRHGREPAAHGRWVQLFAGVVCMVASLLMAESGNWHGILLAAAAMNAPAAALALLVPQPLRRTRMTAVQPLREQAGAA